MTPAVPSTEATSLITTAGKLLDPTRPHTVAAPSPQAAVEPGRLAVGPQAIGQLAPSISTPPDRRVMALRRFAMSITAFTVVGHLFLGFEQAPITPIVTLLVGYALALGLEWLHAWSVGRPPAFSGGRGQAVTFLLPTHIAALACAMLLYAGDALWPYCFAITVAVGTKYLVKAPVGPSWRHTLNPSNTGIVVTLLLFTWVGIAPPYQFTASVVQPWDWLIPLGILTAGSLLNARLTGKTWLILAWVAGFGAQAVVRHFASGTELVPALLPMTGVAFVLFTNYMITDPGTTPFKPRSQILFGLGVAAIYGALVNAHISFGLFFALVLTCGVRTAWLYGAHFVIEPARRRWSRP